MMAEILMSAEEFVRRHLDAQKHKTIYMYACYGFQVNTTNIANKSKQNLNGWYTPANIAKLQAVANQTPPTWGFDCVNLTKGILWGWTGDETQSLGGAKYGANGVPDTNANGMIGRCKEVSTDFSRIEVGEGLWLEGHWGVYVGDGLAVECTGRWTNGVQITSVWNLGKKSGYNGRYWTKHGKLPWIAYSGEVDNVEPEVIELGSRTIKRGTQGSDVRELQEALLKLGYALPKFGADGDCGSETVAVICLFQEEQGLEVDGKFGPASLAALRKALAQLEKAAETVPADPMKLTYTVTLRKVSAADKDTLIKHWPDAEVEQE